MSGKLAAYDSALVRAEANYWAWSHPDLPASKLQTILYEVIPTKPEDIENVTPDAIVGGLRSLNDQECVAYRFMNGGRDRDGRPGRFVVLLAVLDIGELLHHDATSLLRASVMTQLAQDAAKGEIPQPADLDISVIGESPSVTPSLLRRLHGNNEVDLDDVAQASQAITFVVSRPDCRPFSLTIDTRSEGHVGALRLPAALHFTDQELGISQPVSRADQTPPPHPVIRQGPNVAPTDIGIANAPNRFWSDYRFQRNIVTIAGAILLIILLIVVLNSGGAPTGPRDGGGPFQRDERGSLPPSDTQSELLAYIHYHQVVNAGQGPSIEKIAGYFFGGNIDEARRALRGLHREGKVAERSDGGLMGRTTTYRLLLSAEDIRRLPHFVPSLHP